MPGADFREGTAEAIPAEDDAFDLVIASFSLIFTPDPARAAAEIVRVLRPGGRLVASSWVPEGGIHEASAALMEVMARYFPGGGTRPPWGDPAFFRALFDGAQVTRGELVFEAPSAARWFADQEDRHPAWRAARAALAPFPEAWPEVRARSVGALERASVGSDSLRVVSGFWVVRVVVGEGG